MHEPSPAWAHGPIRPLFHDVFFVLGTNKVQHEGVDLQTSRTMLILREGTDLTLVNTVRLDPTGLQALEALGNVKHVIRLGAFHGRDDPFYRSRYGALLWALPHSAHADGREPDEILNEDARLSVGEARVFAFHSAKHPEAALLLEREGGVLVTCDAIQNWTCFDPFFSEATFAMFDAQGLIREANIPSTWLFACEPQRTDFDRLLTLRFQHLITAHGEPLLGKAHARVQASVSRVFDV